MIIKNLIESRKMLRLSHSLRNLRNLLFNWGLKTLIFTTVLITSLVRTILLMLMILLKVMLSLLKRGILMIGRNLEATRRVIKSNLIEALLRKYQGYTFVIKLITFFVLFYFKKFFNKNLKYIKIEFLNDYKN